MTEYHISLTGQERTLQSTQNVADETPNAAIPPIFAIGTTTTQTETVTTSIINSTDDAAGSSSAVEGTTADPQADHVIKIGGVAMSAITNPRLPDFPENFNNPLAGPPILGGTTYTWPDGHIPIPTIP